MKYEFVLRPEIEKTTSFKLNCDLSSQTEYYYEILADGSSYYFVGWIDDECKPKQSDRRFTAGQDLHSWTLYSRGYKYHNNNLQSYGKRIQSNDVIGCYIDLNKKLCNFFINGKELGEIFKNNMVISGNIYPVFSIHGGCIKVMVNKQRIKYFKKVKMLYPNCKILDLGNKYFFKNTSHLIGELSLDTEYKKLSPLIGKCTKGHSLTKYDYTNTTKIRGRCIKCYYSSKLSYPRNNLFASFAEKAKSIEKKEEFEAHYIFSCDRCTDYNLCSSCYVNEEISWYMIAERLKSMDSFKKKLLWHNLASLIGLENSRGFIDKSNRLKFFYYLIQEIRLEKQDKLSWILSWDAIYEVLNIKNIINGEIQFDQFDENNIMNVYQNAEWFETKSHEYFSILHIYAGSPKNQIKDYVLSPNGYKMRLKSLNVEKQHKNGTHLCFICHDFRYMNYRKMSSTKKDRTFWISEKDESVMVCYAHGCTYGDGAGGSIQQTKQWINTAYQLTLLLRELKIIIDDNEDDSAVNNILDTLLSFNDKSSSDHVNVFKHQFITCINRICKILSYQNTISLIELLTHHLPGLILFFIANLPNPVSLRNFFAKYVDPVLEDYYWTFTSRYSSINDKYFESETESLYDGDPYDEFDDIYVNLSDDKKCWSKFGDFLRTVPEDYKKLIPKSLETPISDVMTIMKQDEIEALFNRFADDYFRYKKWRWNMVKTAENEQYIKSEIKNIVKMLIDNQANSDDSFKLNIDSFINDENWANAFVSYQHVKNKENKTNDDDINDEKYQTTAPEIELSELKTLESELTHFSLFTTNIDSEKIWFYFMFPDENEIRFRISTTSKLGVNNISFKFCSYDNPTMDEAVDFYENEEILYNDYWYDLKYNSSKYSVSLNEKIVKESIITKPKWIGIAIQTDLETHEHFVISSINFDDTLINSWMKRTKKIESTDYVLLIDKIMSKRNNWFDPFESHIKDLFANYNVDVRKLENMSLFPQSQHAVEIRIKSFPYPLPPYILKEALKIDFSILSLLGSEFIVKKQIIYSKIKMHYKLYQYIMKCNEKEFHHKDENKKKKFLSHFYTILKLRQKRKETQSFIFLTHSDESIEEDKEREDDLENEEKYAADDYDMDVVNEMDINDAKYSLSYQEIILINKDFYKLLSEKVLTFESTDEMHHNYLLKASKNTLESLYCDPIWMWIDLFPARQQTLEINTDKLTNDGYCVVKCNFGVDTAILSNKPLPLINCGWTGKKMYYEMNIKNIGSSVTTKCSLGFVLEESFDTITSTTIPGKHPFSYGIDGDKGQLLISNKEQKDNYLEIPFSNDQTIGAGITIAKYDKNAQKKSYINYTFMHKDSSGSELKQYPVNKSLLPQDIMHTFYPFLSVGSKGIIVEINFGPTFNYKTMSDRIKQRVLGFKSKKDWTEDWADNTERIAIFDNLLKDVDDKTEKDKKNISKIREIESVMYKILETDLVRLTEVLLRIRVATDQLNKDSFDDNISEIDKKSISHSLYLLCIIYYILYLVDLKNLGREDWTKMNYLIGLNESGKAGFPYNLKNNIQLKKILKLQNKLKRQNNIKLFKSINEYSYELISIDNNIGNMGIRRKHVSNYSSADAPEPFTYLAKLASSNQSSEGQQYLLSLWKMISRDRLFNASQSSEQALKQEFLLDFIACFLSKPSKLKIITELINKWTNASQMLERDTSSFSYDYELKILVSGLIRSSRNPISTAIQTAIYLTNYSELFPDIEEDIMKVSVFCEENAVKYLADIQSNRLRVIALEANNTLVRSLDHGLETFIASNEVQFLKQLIWTNSSDTLLLNAIDAETFRDNTAEFSQWGITYFSDYINMFINWNNMKEFVFTINSTKNWFFSPIGKVQFESIVTTGHMLLVLYMATELQSVYQSASMNGLEMLFHLINCNFFLSEINQIINDSRYTKEFTNFFDLASIVGYVGIFVLRLMVFLEIKVCPERLMATHCIDSNYNAVYLLVWCLTIASVCLRFVWLLFPFKTMGLMVTSMIKMIGDIINFIIFVFVFIVGFATVFYMSTGAQDGFDSWDGSFISIIYGMLDGMDNSDFQDQYANTYRELLINALVLFYVILAVVTLLNFLIAVMTQTYENVAGRAEIDVNIHRWKICYSHYDLPVLPAPFQAIPIILRIVLRYIIEPLLYFCFRKYVNHAWFVGKSFGLRSIHENDEVVGDDVGSDDGENDVNNKTNEADNSISHHQVEHILITPFCMKSHIKNAGCWRRLKTIYYEMNAGQLPSNAQIENEYNFWICSYCLFINGEKNSSQEDVFNYYEYNNKQEPDFAFRDEDLKFIQTMEIDLCDNCFRPRQDCSRNEVWDSIFSFYIYHILSFLCLRLPLMILFFVLFVIIAIFAAVFAMFEACFCNNSQIKNIFMDWFRYYNDDIHGYEIKLVNPYQVYTALKKPIIRQEKLKGNNKKNFDEYDDEIATKVINKIFEYTDEILDEDEIDLISQKYKHLIKNKVEEAIILTDNVDWNALNEFIKIIKDNTQNIANFVKDANRNLLEFIDEEEDDEIKEILEFTSQNINAKYTFTNSPVLYKMQNIEDAISQNQVVETENN